MIDQLLFLIFLICMSAFFSASESAIFSLSPAKLKALEKSKSRRAKMLVKMRKNPQRLLINILIGNNLVNIAASASATIIFYKLLGSAGPAIATGVLTGVILVFGEIGPKSFAQSLSEKTALAVIPYVSILDILFRPASIILEDFNSRLLKKLTKGKHVPRVSQEELESMAEIGVEEGVVKHQEQEMIKKVLEFKDITAEDVMTPRARIFALPANLTLEKALPKIIREHYTRIPIYEKGLDNITGVIFLPDILKEVVEGGQKVLLKTIAKKANLIPKQRKIDEIFKDFQRQRRHIAVVLDEEGITVGVVTLEDLLEEIVGEIMDERDVDEFLIKRIDRNTILVDAGTEIKEIQDFLHIEVGDKPQELISSVALEKFGRIPRPGDEAQFDGFKMVIEKATPKKIEKIRIIKTV